MYCLSPPGQKSLYLICVVPVVDSTAKSLHRIHRLPGLYTRSTFNVPSLTLSLCTLYVSFSLLHASVVVAATFKRVNSVVSMKDLCLAVRHLMVSHIQPHQHASNIRLFSPAHDAHVHGQFHIMISGHHRPTPPPFALTLLGCIWWRIACCALVHAAFSAWVCWIFYAHYYADVGENPDSHSDRRGRTHGQTLGGSSTRTRFVISGCSLPCCSLTLFLSFSMCMPGGTINPSLPEMATNTHTHTGHRPSSSEQRTQWDWIKPPPQHRMLLLTYDQFHKNRIVRSEISGKPGVAPGARKPHLRETESQLWDFQQAPDTGELWTAMRSSDARARSLCELRESLPMSPRARFHTAHRWVKWYACDVAMTHTHNRTPPHIHRCGLCPLTQSRKQWTSYI